jgi:hypothetical protein
MPDLTDIFRGLAGERIFRLGLMYPAHRACPSKCAPASPRYSANVAGRLFCRRAELLLTTLYMCVIME